MIILFRNFTDKTVVEKVITEVNLDAVIHCTAWNAVDMAEDDDKAQNPNSRTARIICYLMVRSDEAGG